MDEASVPVDVGWALWGKQQGTRSDYSVLACSTEPLSETEFNHVLTHFVAGTPSAEPNRPDSLPWVIVSRVGVGDQPYMGLSIQTPAGTSDAAGRPAISTSYFCIPYAAVSGAPVTYSGLYQRLRHDAQMPYQNSALIPLRVPRLDPRAVTSDVDTLGESVVVATAAMLLSGPVSVVGAEGARLEERLAFIDAVAALLPYGYRTAYTAATWSDSGTRHPIRLAFASRARQTAGVVRWKAGPATPLTDASKEFVTLYDQIRDRPGQASPAERAAQLAKLIGTLARDAAPCGWDQPDRALQALRDFDLPFLVLSAVRTGSVDSAAGFVTSADVRRVFTESRIEELELDEQREVLAELIAAAHREPLNWLVADDWWERLTQRDSLPLLRRIVATVQELVLARAPRVAIMEYSTRADQHGILDPLLAGLVAGLGVGDGQLAVARAVAEQVADSVGREADPEALPQTRQALAGNLLLASLMLVHLADAQRELGPVRTWLGPVLGGTLTAFFTVLGQVPGRVSEHDIEILARSDAGCVAILLTAAHGHGRLDLVLPGFTSWLGRAELRPGTVDPGMAAYCQDQAVALRPTEPETQAQLDLALLITGKPPQFLLERRDNASQQRYNEATARGWKVLAGDLAPVGDEALTESLRIFLARGSWAHDGAQANAVAGLVTRLTRDGQRRALDAALREVLARTPAARRWSFARGWLPPEPQSRRPAESKRVAPENKQPAPEGKRPAADGRQPGTYEGRHAPGAYGWSAPDKHEYPAPKTYRPAPEGDPARAATPRPGNARAEPVAARIVLSGDATAAEVAEYCTSAFIGRRRLDDVTEEMSRAGVIRSGAQASAVLRELRHSLISSSGNYPEAEIWLKRLTEDFAEERLGPGTGPEFRSLAAQSMIEDIFRLSEMLRILVAREEHGLLDPHDSHTEKLGRSIKNLEESRKEGKRRSSRTPMSRLLGRPGGDGGDEQG
jgi:hypothetical protein